MKKQMYCNVKQNKGITMIALIIIIILLLLLAAVAIYTISDNNAIKREKENQKNIAITQEKEKLHSEVLEWKLTNVNGNPTLKKYLSDIYGEENVKEIDGENSLEVTVPSGNKYSVDTEENVAFIGSNVSVGDITIDLDKEKIELNLDTGIKKVDDKEITTGDKTLETITAILNNAKGTLSWESSDTNVAEIRNTTGNDTSATSTIWLKNPGEATITVTYGEAKATCKITITKTDKTSYWTQNGLYVTDENNGTVLVVGQNVKGYEKEYTNTDGKTTTDWAVLGAENGKLLLVSKYNVKSNVKMCGLYKSDGYECGYCDGVDYLNSVCSVYNDENLAAEARSIKIEDIHRVFKFVPEIDRRIDVDEAVANYGESVTYTMGTTEDGNYDSKHKKGFYTWRNNVTGETGGTGTSVMIPFFYPTGENGLFSSGKNLEPSQSITYTQTGYSFDSNLSREGQEGEAYKTLIEEAYWLASTYVGCGDNGVYFGLRIKVPGVEEFYGNILWYTQRAIGYQAGSGVAGAKAVVVLKREVNVNMNQPTVADANKIVTISIGK